jgi:hypothetical protein
VNMQADLENNRSEVHYYENLGCKLHTELEMMEARCSQLSHVEDWTAKCREVRHHISMCEAEMVKINRKQSVRERHNDKITTIIYVDDPRAAALRKQLEEMKARNRTLSQQISFHDKRISVGTFNYANMKTNVVDSSGHVVQERRTLRKSNKHADNKYVTISTYGGSGSKRISHGSVDRHRNSGAQLVQSQIVSSHGHHHSGFKTDDHAE